MMLWPTTPEYGAPFRMTARCGDCDGTGTAEMPRGSGRFDDCQTCGGNGEIEVDPAEMRERADA